MQAMVCQDGGLTRAFHDGKSPALQGMSGGGIWLKQEALKGELWLPYVALLGIQLAYKPDERWIRGVRIGRWLHLVGVHYPELRETIRGLQSRIETGAQ
jgi:hypothetical protein